MKSFSTSFHASSAPGCKLKTDTGLNDWAIKNNSFDLNIRPFEKERKHWNNLDHTKLAHFPSGSSHIRLDDNTNAEDISFSESVLDSSEGVNMSSENNCYNMIKVKLRKTNKPLLNFLLFKWLYKNKKRKENLQIKETNKIKDTKMLNKVSNIRYVNTICSKTRTFSNGLKVSYSFDDIQCFAKRWDDHNVEEKKKLLYSNNFRSNQNICEDSSISDGRDCPLCLCKVDIRKIHSIWSCGCSFCLSCLRIYLTLAIKENHVNELSCPDGNCPKANDNYITQQEIELLVNSSTFLLYKKFKLDWEIEKDPNRTWCPTANCDNICVIGKRILNTIGTNSETKRSLEERESFYCNKCNTIFCAQCRRSWHECNCYLDDNVVQIDINNTEIKELGIKKCPRCCVWIERDEGCAQIMCKRCRHVFCWFCLQSLEDDFLLLHFDKGPCKNKLGHSRASVMWHRTQAIAMLAGCGILLFLASPLFIISAPCIVCCNCFCSTPCKYMDETSDEEDEYGAMGLSSAKENFLFSSK